VNRPTKALKHDSDEVHSVREHMQCGRDTRASSSTAAADTTDTTDVHTTAAGMPEGSCHILSRASSSAACRYRNRGHACCRACCLQENFEANSDNGAFEAQYRKLLAEIQQIYESAKEFHGKVGGWAYGGRRRACINICCMGLCITICSSEACSVVQNRSSKALT
jgi:hypothetical protein